MILVIAAEKNAGFAVGLTKKNKLFDFLEINQPFKQTERLLAAIDRLLKRRKIKLADLRGIVVASGPGEFSALRTGIATANALGYALKIKVVGVKLPREFSNNKIKLEFLLNAGEKELRKKNLKTVMPVYGGEPNISKTIKKPKTKM